MLIDAIRMDLVGAIQGIASGVGEYTPKLLLAVIFIVLGFVFGSAVGRVVTEIVKRAKVDELLSKGGVDRFLSRGGYSLDSGMFLGWLAKAFFVIVFLVAAFDVLGLSQVNEFLKTILAYIPQVIVAALMLFFASIASDLLGNLVAGATRAVGVHIAQLLGTLVRWAIWFFAVIIALSHLGIAAQYMYTLFAGLVAMLALAGGLAFGLGGKDAATELIKNIRAEIKEGREK